MAQPREQHVYENESVLTVRELATLLRVSRTLVYRMAERRDLPFYRLPNGLRFLKREVDKYLAARFVAARDDV